MELYKRIIIAKELIDDDPGSTISMSELAAKASMSEFHFYRTFKQALGISPHQYRLQVRIEKAKSLMHSSLQPLKEIAAATGFADVHCFSKAFKSCVGVSPGRFRESGY